MKANELMRGDWVYVPHNGRATHYGCVCDIYDTGAVSTTIGLAKARSLRPILLTPGILEGRGFSFGNTTNEEDCDNPAEKGWCYCDENGEVKVTFPHGTDGGEIFVNNYSFRTLRLIFPDKIYLHELQHALKLGGFELEIKLYHYGRI